MLLLLHYMDDGTQSILSLFAVEKRKSEAPEIDILKRQLILQITKDINVMLSEKVMQQFMKFSYHGAYLVRRR
jgi:hypothetical protein